MLAKTYRPNFGSDRDGHRGFLLHSMGATLHLTQHEDPENPDMAAEREKIRTSLLLNFTGDFVFSVTPGPAATSIEADAVTGETPQPREGERWRPWQWNLFRRIDTLCKNGDKPVRFCACFHDPDTDTVRGYVSLRRGVWNEKLCDVMQIDGKGYTFKYDGAVKDITPGAVYHMFRDPISYLLEITHEFTHGQLDSYKYQPTDTELISPYMTSLDAHHMLAPIELAALTLELEDMRTHLLEQIEHTKRQLGTTHDIWIREDRHHRPQN